MSNEQDKIKHSKRIHQKQNNFKKWMSRVKSWYTMASFSEIEKTAHIAANHGKLCSCWMCGNARKTEGPTIQELKAPKVKEELE